MIVGLDHIQLAMPPGKEDDARRFYSEVLGLREVEKPEPLKSRGGCWFEGKNTFVHLGVQKGFIPARKAHPAFLVRDLSSFQEMLIEENIAVQIDGSLPGIRRCYLRDPFENRIELIEEQDGFSGK